MKPKKVLDPSSLDQDPSSHLTTNNDSLEISRVKFDRRRIKKTHLLPVKEQEALGLTKHLLEVIEVESSEEEGQILLKRLKQQQEHNQHAQEQEHHQQKHLQRQHELQQHRPIRPPAHQRVKLTKHQRRRLNNERTRQQCQQPLPPPTNNLSPVIPDSPLVKSTPLITPSGLEFTAPHPPHLPHPAPPRPGLPLDPFIPLFNLPPLPFGSPSLPGLIFSPTNPQFINHSGRPAPSEADILSINLQDEIQGRLDAEYRIQFLERENARLTQRWIESEKKRKAIKVQCQGLLAMEAKVQVKEVMDLEERQDLQQQPQTQEQMNISTFSSSSTSASSSSFSSYTSSSGSCSSSSCSPSPSSIPRRLHCHNPSTV